MLPAARSCLYCAKRAEKFGSECAAKLINSFFNLHLGVDQVSHYDLEDHCKKFDLRENFQNRSVIATTWHLFKFIEPPGNIDPSSARFPQRWRQGKK